MLKTATNKREKKIKQTLIVKILIAFSSILILILPIAEVFTIEFLGKKGSWVDFYIYEDEINLAILIPFYISYLLYFFLKDARAEKILKPIILFTSGFLFLIGFLSLGMLTQDLVFLPSVLIVLVFFPLFLILFRIEKE